MENIIKNCSRSSSLGCQGLAAGFFSTTTLFPGLYYCAASLKADARRNFSLNNNFTYLLHSHCGSCCFHNTVYGRVWPLSFVQNQPVWAMTAVQWFHWGWRHLGVVSTWACIIWDQCLDRSSLLCSWGEVDVQCPPSLQAPGCPGREAVSAQPGVPEKFMAGGRVTRHSG